MSNQVLALHRVSRRCFDLAGVRTGSVRDQLLRSTAVINALAGEGMIGRGLPLLVYGAGAAGMNAAMLAAEHHTDVTVVERTDQEFSTIGSAWWRRIDPTEYDWPHVHWTDSIFPASGSIPLAQKGAADGALLASAWRLQWDNFSNTLNGIGRFGTVTILHKLDAYALQQQDQGPMLQVTGTWQAGSAVTETRQFGALVSCVGHGNEQVTEEPLLGNWNHYAGPEFWNDCDGIAADAPLPDGVTTVLVSGGGDGGMQDFQRVATSCCGRELYERLEAVAKDYPGTEIVPNDSLLIQFMCAEDVGRRAFSWAPSRHGVPAALIRWHEAFVRPIEDLVDNVWSANVRQDVARRLFRDELLTGPLKVIWVLRESTPGYAYALNRFLSVLLIVLAKHVLAPGKLVVHAASKVTGIDGVGHRCMRASDCIGVNHHVLIEPVTGGTCSVVRDVNLIIIRHGVEARAPLLGARQPFPEQISPYNPPF